MREDLQKEGQSEPVYGQESDNCTRVRRCDSAPVPHRQRASLRGERRSISRFDLEMNLARNLRKRPTNSNRRTRDLASNVHSIRLEDRHSNHSNTKFSWYSSGASADRQSKRCSARPKRKVSHL